MSKSCSSSSNAKKIGCGKFVDRAFLLYTPSMVRSFFNQIICAYLLLSSSTWVQPCFAASGQIMQQYKAALDQYNLHRRIFAANITGGGTTPSMPKVGQGPMTRLPGGFKPDIKLPPMRLAPNDPFADLALLDESLTNKTLSLYTDLQSLLQQQDKISTQEFNDALGGLQRRADSLWTDTESFERELARQQNTTSHKITQLMYAADRDGIQNEYDSTFSDFKNLSRVQNELTKRSQYHLMARVFFQEKLGKLRPTGPEEDVPRQAQNADQIDLVCPPGDDFARLDVVGQQAALDREYARVKQLFSLLSR
jgi:hypothetical protein